MTEAEFREAAARWLSLVAADAELSPYLMGLDWDRLKAHVARTLTTGEELPHLGWSEAQHRRATDYLTGALSRPTFWEQVEDRCPGLLPERDGPLVEAALRQLTREDSRPNRLALLTVLGRAYRHYGLRPEHEGVIDDALRTRVPWRRVERAARRAGEGPAWWPAEVIDHDRAADGIAVLTVRPWRRLLWRPGQAVPVCTPRHPGRWRWYCPANAPRPDGTVELHVRAVRGGAVSTSLVHEVRPGELLHLGPPADTGLHLGDGRDLLLVAGGTGLAPLRALVEQVAASPGSRRVTLVVGARSVESLYDAITLDKLRHDWLTIVPAFFSHDLYAEPAEQGDALTVGLYHHRPGQHVYVCGPPLMLAGARLRLLAAGVPANHLHLPNRIPWQ